MMTEQRVKRQELGDVVILDLDAGKVETPFDDLHMLPTEIVSCLFFTVVALTFDLMYRYHF